MSEIGHSTLLKFFMNTSKMSEQGKITIKSEVPGEQALRGDYILEMKNENVPANDVAKQDYSLSPVMTITKEESTFTKGDLKLQKVIVKEDISDERAMKTVKKLASPGDVKKLHSEESSVTINEGDAQTDQKVVYKVTKIPKLKFQQAVDIIKKEEETIKEGKNEAVFRPKAKQIVEAVPKLINEKRILPQLSRSEPKNQDSPKVDDEFDKIYDEIFENGPPSGNFPSPGKIEDVDKLETKFEEIIHAYDEQKPQAIHTETVKSKIPLLKRKSEQDIFVSKPTIRKNSLKKQNSLEDTVCKLPVPVSREKQNFEKEAINSSQLSQNQTMETNPKIISAKNVSVIETVNTNISKTVTITPNQKSNEKIMNQDSEYKTESEDLKSKIPILGKSVAVDKVSDIQTTKIALHMNFDKKSEDNNKIEKVIKENTNKPLNLKNNISDIKAQSLVIKDNMEKEHNTEDKNEAASTAVAAENYADKRYQDKRYQGPKTETKMNIETKVEVKNSKPINDSAQNEKILDATKSNNDFHEKNKHSENNIFKTKLQNIHINETNSDITSDQEVRETSIVPIQFSNSETKNIQHDQKDKINDIIIKDTSKDILNESDKEINLETNPIDNNSKQKITYEENKYKASEQTININNNINVDRESTKNITELILEKQDNISKDVEKSDSKINSNNLSQEYIINKRESELPQKSITLSPSKISNEVISTANKEVQNSPSVDIKEEKTVQPLISNQQSDSKIQQQEITKEETKNPISQEHSRKPENIYDRSKEINKKKTTEEIQDNPAIIANKVNSAENYKKDFNNLEEEDIIVLKGKVNRIISRLDSKELKANKCELDDVPTEVSVISRIALFETDKSIDTTQAPSTKHQISDINLDKPKIVNGILKVENGSSQSDSKFSYDTFLNYKKSIKNNLIDNRIQTSRVNPITKFDEIYETDINLNNFNKTNPNKTECLGDEVFSKNKEANRNIINEYKINKEIDIRRAKSLAELNFEGVQGRVRQMVVRMNSIDKMALERREKNEIKKKTERKRHGSVSERIALFEQDANEESVHLMKKITPIRMESVSTTTASPKPEELSPTLNEEEIAKRITELAQARATYGQYDNMTYVELSDGGRLPTLAVGTALLDSQLIKPVIKAAIDLGFRAFDTAYIYGNEQAVGEAIREKIQDGTVKREELFVLSKLWSTNHRRDLVPRACRQSLDTMGLDYFDLYLIHNPMSFKEGPNPIPKIANVIQYSEHDYLDAWYGIEGLIKEGLVKRGGVSNFNSLQVGRILEKGKIKPVVNQVECHPYLSQARMQEFLSTHGIAMSCFGTLGSSGTPRALRSSLPSVIHDPLVRTMAAGIGVSPAQLLISYQVSLGRGVVVKASSAEHLWDNLQALGLRLAPAHAAALAALNRNKRTFTFEGMGDTHKNYPFKVSF